MGKGKTREQPLVQRRHRGSRRTGRKGEFTIPNTLKKKLALGFERFLLSLIREKKRGEDLREKKTYE